MTTFIQRLASIMYRKRIKPIYIDEFEPLVLSVKTVSLISSYNSLGRRIDESITDDYNAQKNLINHGISLSDEQKSKRF